MVGLFESKAAPKWIKRQRMNEIPFPTDYSAILWGGGLIISTLQETAIVMFSFFSDTNILKKSYIPKISSSAQTKRGSTDG